MRPWFFVLAIAFSSPALAVGDAPETIAQGLIDQAQMQDVFATVEDEHPTVRHVASGLTCTFFLDGETSGRLHVYESSPRGDDVSCEMQGPEETTSLYATRYPEGTSAREQLDGASAAIVQRFPDARARQPSLTMTLDGTPPHEERHFFITIDGQRYLTMVSVAIIGEWVIKLRYTASAPDDDMLRQRELMAGAIMLTALMKMTGDGPTAPAR